MFRGGYLLWFKLWQLLERFASFKFDIFIDVYVVCQCQSWKVVEFVLYALIDYKHFKFRNTKITAKFITHA